MAADYDAIREANLHKYGHESRHLELFASLYSDRTHFLFELLQNAEDAGATEVEFRLHENGLELIHDGREFTAADVEGICGVGDGTKAEDLTKIGRFGIGFKSVYVYTSTPEIHSGGEHFSIETYVRPHASATRPDVALGGTHFWFPFNHADIGPVLAHAEIEQGLRRLDARTLLFLRSITRICWKLGTDLQSILERRRDDIDDVALVSLEHGVGGQEAPKSDEQWLVFGAPVQHPDLEHTRSGQRVEMAFRLGEAEDGLRVERLHHSPLAVFFPTQKDTRLGFLIQGPFRTTPARDNVPNDDPWNQALIGQLADMLPTALIGLRDRGLLAAAALRTMPHVADDFEIGSMFAPLYERFAETVRSNQILPRHGGGFLDGTHARLARTAGVRELVNNAELTTLLGTGVDMGWVTGDITDERARDLYRFLRDECDIEEIAPVELVSLLHLGFLEGQTDQWVEELYGFLGEQGSLLRQARKGEGPLVERPIVRLEDGSHVVPFTAGQPNAYLPTADESQFPTVRAEVVGARPALQFMRELGLKPPDAAVEVTEFILPKYEAEAGDDLLDDEALRVDAQRIFTAIRALGQPRRSELIQRLQRVAFLVGEFAGERRLARPRHLYQRSAELEVYLEGNPDLGFVDDRYLEWTGELEELGVVADVRTRKQPKDRRGNVVMSRRHGHHERGVNGFDPNFAIEGLDEALAYPNAARARVVWSLLRRHRADLRGEVESSTNQQYSNSTRSLELSIAGEVVSTWPTPWIPKRDGTLVLPKEISLEDLPPGFEQDETLASILGMAPSGIGKLSEQAGISADLVRAIADDPELEQEMLAFVEKRRARSAADPVTESGIAPEAFADAVGSAFDRPARPGRPDPEERERDDSVVANPDRRRSLVQDEIADAQGEEQGVPAFKLVSRRVWNAKDSAVKAFLVEQYAGRCQICDAGFDKRNGEPYAEAIYLAPAAKAAWVDRPGNVVCLCPTCAAKFQHGDVEADGFVGQALATRLDREGGDGTLELKIALCGEACTIRFTERHLLDLQELLRLSVQVEASSRPSEAATTSVASE